jgi:hypothetical protein
MPTTRAILTDALLEIGVGSPGEILSADLMDIALRYFQRQLNAWQADELSLAVSNRVTYTLPSGTASSTIGPTGDIVAQRPVFVNQINYIVPSSIPPVEVPMASMSDQQFQNLTIKSLSSSLPTQYYYQTSITGENGTITWWPVVTQDIDLALYLQAGVAEPTTLQTVITVPPGYTDAFHYDLAVRLCGPLGIQVPPTLQQMRTQALMTMKRPNVEPGMLGVDQALLGGTGGAYNILSDTTTGSSSR